MTIAEPTGAHGTRTVLGKACGDTTEQALQRLSFTRGQPGEQRFECRRPGSEGSIGRARAGTGEHEGDRAAIPAPMATHQPARLKTINEPHGGRLRPTDDAGQGVHRTARPRLQMNKRPRLRFAQVRAARNRVPQSIHGGQGGHAKQLLYTFGHGPDICISHLMRHA